jgi:hypothetical protein
MNSERIIPTSCRTAASASSSSRRLRDYRHCGMGEPKRCPGSPGCWPLIGRASRQRCPPWPPGWHPGGVFVFPTRIGTGTVAIPLHDSAARLRCTIPEQVQRVAVVRGRVGQTKSPRTNAHQRRPITKKRWSKALGDRQRPAPIGSRSVPGRRLVDPVAALARPGRRLMRATTNDLAESLDEGLAEQAIDGGLRYSALGPAWC